MMVCKNHLKKFQMKKIFFYIFDILGKLISVIMVFYSVVYLLNNMVLIFATITVHIIIFTIFFVLLEVIL